MLKLGRWNGSSAEKISKHGFRNQRSKSYQRSAWIITA